MRTRESLFFGVVAAAIGCSSPDPPPTPAGPDSVARDGTGSVGVQLTIPGGDHISSVSYKLTDGIHTVSGTVDVSDASVISFVVAGVPAGPGYTLTMSATSDDGIVSCAGQQSGVTILSRATTFINVQLICLDAPNQDAGGVFVKGVFDCCATWDTIVANPSAVPQGGVSALTANASGPCTQLDGGTLVSCVWSVVSGSATIVSQYTDGSGNFYGQLRCPSGVEAETLQLSCADGPLPDGGACPPWSTTGTLTVLCGGLSYSVVRIGDGTVAPSRNFTATFVESHSFTGTDSVTGTTALPTSVPNGTNQPCTLMGTSVNDGALSRSVDGHYLTLGCYGSSPMFGDNGNPLLTTSSPRVVARVDAAGHVDTSTVFAIAPADGGTGGAYVKAAIRGTATLDGTSFWAAGTGNATGGLYYIGFGTQFGGTQLTSADTRTVDIVGGQLLADGTSGFSLPQMSAVGMGLPDAGPVTLGALPGFPSPNDTTSPWQFVVLDLLPVPGPDTIYVATDQTPGGANPPNGVQKWTFDGTVWSLQTTFNVAATISAPLGMRGLTAQRVGNGSVIVLATTGEGTSAAPTPNHVVIISDNGGPYSSATDAGQSVTLTGTFIAQAPANTIYRGLAPSPY
jgi:hypothetical protein